MAVTELKSGGFTRATKSQSFLRAAIYGPAGSGKTYTALQIAKGIGGRVAVIDTERLSSAKYADRFEFDVMDLEDRSIDGYIEAMRQAHAGGYRVLVIDSLTHAWKNLLEEVDRAKRASPTGNSFQQWAKATPKQQSLIEAILSVPMHLVCTMRAKTTWDHEEDDRGKKKPVRVGLEPQQGKDIEYEFDLLCSMNQDNWLLVEKDRTGRFQSRSIERPGPEFGRELAEWIEGGERTESRPAFAAPKPTPEPEPPVDPRSPAHKRNRPAEAEVAAPPAKKPSAEKPPVEKDSLKEFTDSRSRVDPVAKAKPAHETATAEQVERLAIVADSKPDPDSWVRQVLAFASKHAGVEVKSIAEMPKAVADKILAKIEEKG
jgi:hypothetical protein